MNANEFAVVVVGSEPENRGLLHADLSSILGATVDVIDAGSPDGAESRLVDMIERGVRVPLVFVEDEAANAGREFLLAIHERPELTSTRKVFLTSQPSLRNVDRLLRRGAVHGMLTAPWSGDGLRRQLRSHLARWFVDNEPEATERFADVVSDPELARAARSSAEARQAGDRGDSPDVAHFLLDDLDSEDSLHEALVAAIDRALGHPPRLVLAAGAVLIEEDKDVGGVYVILDGVVQLTHRSSVGDLVVHDNSFGGIVGLLSLAQRRRAFHTCRAVTQVRAIPLTLHQLSVAFAREPSLAALLTRVLVASLADRLRDSGELQLEIAELNRRLEAERDQLATALANLEAAQGRLVESARMATLGELSAGVAHELNNPVAAVARSVDQLADDVEALVADSTSADDVELFRQARVGADTSSTAVRRRQKRALVEEFGERRLADRLVAAGLVEVAAARRFLAGAPDEGERDRRLDRRARLVRMGTTVRNVETGSGRISQLVSSLRAYVRGDRGANTAVPVDVVQVVDDTVSMLSHRLRDVDVERRYVGRPEVRGDAGELQQVFTNIIANAVEAMATSDGQPQLTLDVTPVPGGVDVEIGDNGPGVDDAHVARLFEPRFTTKDGRVSFGLGLGLAISRQLIEQQGGTIAVVSEPGDTRFTVHLSDTPPDPSPPSVSPRLSDSPQATSNEGTHHG